MGTLSKALGSCGGYIAGCKEVVEYLKYTAPGFVFSCGLPPSAPRRRWPRCSSCSSSRSALSRLQANSRLFLALAKERGPEHGPEQQHAGGADHHRQLVHALMLSRAMFERGINVQPILYPAVEEEKARLRFFITSAHTEEQIRQTVNVLAEELAKIDPRHLHNIKPMGVGDVKSM